MCGGGSCRTNILGGANFFSSRFQNFLADNIRAASRHGNRRQAPKDVRLEELRERRERELEQHQRGEVPR